MARPARAIIDLDAIRHNYRYAKQLAPNARALAVVKANAYGHGAVRVARALSAEADGFGVACIEEALELRESGIGNRILLLEGIFTPDEMLQVDSEHLTIALHTDDQLQWLLAAHPTHQLDVFLKIDTGMHRLGFAPSQVRRVYSALQQCPHVGSITLMTHFARADEPLVETTRSQLRQFESTVNGLGAPCSLANSAGILAWPHSHRDWIRPGLMLYGVSPMDAPDASGSPVVPGVAESRHLRPAMRLESALISVRELPAGETVGYGGRFLCEQTTRVGVVAMGYADGYPRHAVDGTPIALEECRSRLIGRVSMDMLTMDLGLLDAKPGDRVELWGHVVSAQEVAQCSATIPYTLFTGITRRVPLVYVGE